MSAKDDATRKELRSGLARDRSATLFDLGAGTPRLARTGTARVPRGDEHTS